jgi:hypothetical protein
MDVERPNPTALSVKDNRRAWARHSTGGLIVSRRTPSSGNSLGRPSYRNLIVFGALLGGLSVTTALLLAFSPAPLAPGAASSLFAVEAPDSLDAIFTTQTPLATGRWTSIYIHHSLTPGGDAVSLGQATGGLRDHFLIGNGDGCADGEIQLSQRWSHQRPALAPADAARIDPGCISICLVGDFDHTVPTSVQMRRLAQLVNTLQARFQIPRQNVILLQQARTVSGIGRFFPATAFRQQLLQ